MFYLIEKDPKKLVRLDDDEVYLYDTDESYSVQRKDNVLSIPELNIEGTIKRRYIKFDTEKWYNVDDSYPNLVIDGDVNNTKGTTFNARYIDIISDPNNIYIDHHENAGIVEDGKVCMHNGIQLYNEYYESFSQILDINKGCHEPSEERCFAQVLKFMTKKAVMVELGSYWAYYSIWFNTTVKKAKNYCVEPNLHNLQLGQKNSELNNCTMDFTQMSIANGNFLSYLELKDIEHIDLLHSDIQGAELNMITSIKPMLKHKQINYLFINTHSDPIHYQILDILQECNYRIIASADFETETFCFNGLIVACPSDNLECPEIPIGCRKKTPLRKIPYVN